MGFGRTNDRVSSPGLALHVRAGQSDGRTWGNEM